MFRIFQSASAQARRVTAELAPSLDLQAIVQARLQLDRLLLSCHELSFVDPLQYLKFRNQALFQYLRALVVVVGEAQPWLVYP